MLRFVRRLLLQPPLDRPPDGGAPARCVARGHRPRLLRPHPDIPPYVAEPWHESEKHAAKLAESLGWVMSTDALARWTRRRFWPTACGRSGLTWRPSTSVRSWPGRARCGPTCSRCSRPRSGRRSARPSARRARGDHCRPGRPSLTIRLLGGIEVDSAKPSFAMWELSGWPAGRRGHARARRRDRRPARPARRADLRRGASVPGAFARSCTTSAHGPQRVGSAGADVGDEPRDGIGRHRAHDHGRRRLLADGSHDQAVADRGRATAEVREGLAAHAEALATFDAAMRSSTSSCPPASATSDASR